MCTVKFMNRTNLAIGCAFFLLFTACGEDAVQDADVDVSDSMSGHSDVAAVDIDAVAGDADAVAWDDVPGSPVMTIDPQSFLDFGLTAVGTTSTRKVVVANVGSRDLVVHFGFPIEGDSHEEFLCETQFPLTIKGGESSEVPIVFTNKGVTWGVVTFHLLISTNIPGAEQWSLELRADHGQDRPCVPSLTPSLVDFGVVVPGATNTLTIGISNKGSGYCMFQRLSISDCETAGDSFNCPEPSNSESSELFLLASEGLTGSTPIGPDGVLNLDIAFSPPADAVQSEFAGLLSVIVADQTNPATEYRLPLEEPTGGYVPNLIGSLAVPQD